MKHQTFLSSLSLKKGKNDSNINKSSDSLKQNQSKYQIKTNNFFKKTQNNPNPSQYIQDFHSSRNTNRGKIENHDPDVIQYINSEIEYISEPNDSSFIEESDKTNQFNNINEINNINHRGDINEIKDSDFTIQRNENNILDTLNNNKDTLPISQNNNIEFVEDDFYNDKQEKNKNIKEHHDFIDSYAHILTNFPYSKHIQILKRPKPVSALHIDRTCTRLAVGDHGASIRIYDFGSMDMHMKPHREFENWIGSYKVNQVQWNYNSELLLVIPDRNSPKLFSRDGKDKGDFKSGDPYIVEKQKVLGHTAAVKCGQWHPWNNTLCITGSLDGTLRFWNTTGKFRNSSSEVIKVKSLTKKYDTVYSCDFKKRDAEIIAIGTGSGSILLYPNKGPYINSIDSYHLNDNHINRIHSFNPSVISLNFSDDGHTLASRTLDNKLKIFDIRNFKSPLKEFHDLPCSFEETNVLFSPNDKYIISGTSIQDNGSIESGEIVIIDKFTLEILYKGPIPSIHGSIINIQWAERTNQLYFGTSNGELIALYDESKGSHDGILQAISKGYTKKEIREHARSEIIITPFQYENEIAEKRKNQRNLENQYTPHQKKSSGPGFGGEIGVTHSQTILKKLGIGAVSEEELRENPRDAILKYAKEAEENPRFITQAYKNTQPVTILDMESSYKEHEEITKKDNLKRSLEYDVSSRFNSKPEKRQKSNE